MLLKKIIIENIRSYENEEIDFLEGSTLLSGDIGSGKTSILLGIEFALFGLQPGQRGSSLLRNGKDNGGATIEFEVDGKEVIVKRTLKRGKTISQDFCSIQINGETKELSVTELKNKVLELLNYPKEFSKKQNILYKFTVYTPQEEMKQIILQDAETRLNTLRHVFGIDKYKKILENISVINTKIREEKRIKEAMTSNLEEDKADIILKETDLEAKHSNLSSIEKELFLKTEERKKFQEEKQEIFTKIQEKSKFQQEVEKSKIMISNKKETILSNSKTMSQIKIQLEEFQKLIFDESKIFQLEQEVETKTKEKQDINEKNLQITSEISSLNLKNQENDNLKSKISHLDICPTCLQDVDSVYKSNVVNKSDLEISRNVQRIKELTLQKQEVFQEMSNVDQEISSKQKQIQELKIIKVRLQGIQEKQIRLEELEKSNISLEKDMDLLNQHIETLKQSLFELNKFDNLFETKQKELDNALVQERQAEIKVAELKKEIEFLDIQIQELKQKITKTQEIREQLNYLTELENWLSKKFIPVISFVEKNVMTKLKSEFSQLFAKWFYMLVSDSFNVRLSDDFTPIIEQQDYEIDYAYLSGGERTAIALAYRLSLNQVINSLLSKIKTRDVVILDEPTDGFSDQQLDKMRSVLEELNVKQLIIVSHEQKIEGFVENVVRFKKENGISKKE
ncbi:AAA family ATPase [Candidatus Pacearchaeota archaeon]|nr:AAA family ATPase [Candidatus Pacearchaeota archaeon]